MKNPLRTLLIFCAALALAPLSFAGQTQMLPSGTASFDPAEAADSSAADDPLYVDGTRAIHENRWADAESIFSRVAGQHGEHAEGALYWKAYAENKLGQPARALATCTQLRSGFPNSHWLNECGALEIEIHGHSGHPVEPTSEHDQNLKLLALNTLMQKDETHALPQIEQILLSDQPEVFKENALFVVAQSSSPQARQMLQDIAKPAAEAPASIRLNPALQQRASQLIVATRASKSGTIDINRLITLDVLVTDAAGKPVSGLAPGDFTVLDKGQPQKLVTFQAFPGPGTPAKPAPPSEIMILIDTINTPILDVAYARQQIAILLRQNGGVLDYPVSIYIFNGNGASPISPATRDGNALAAALERVSPNLHPIRRSAGVYGAEERIELSLNALRSLAFDAGLRPGRKTLFWLSPGWPLLQGTEILETNRQHQYKFNSIVQLSTALRLSRITLYSVDPIRQTASDFGEWFRYKDFLAPVTKVNNAEYANLTLQVLAEQSGGRAMNFSNDYLAGEIGQCFAETGAGYFLSFNAQPAAHSDEFHDLKLTVNRPGLVVHTRNGYYNQP